MQYTVIEPNTSLQKQVFLAAISQHHMHDFPMLPNIKNPQTQRGAFLFFADVVESS